MRVPEAKGTLLASVEAAGYTSAFEHATDGEVWTDMVPSARACVTAIGGIRLSDGAIEDVRASWCSDRGAVGLADK